MKKQKNKILSIIVFATLFVSCNNNQNVSINSINDSSINSEEELFGKELVNSFNDETKDNLGVQGYASFGIGEFEQYQNTDYYRVVSTEEEFINALYDARYDYETIWDNDTNSYTQTLNKEGSVRVIEIINDLNLGYYKLSDEVRSKTEVVSDFASKYSSLKDYLYFSNMFLENGISQIKIERTSNLMIFSKNGAKITHAGFKLTSCDNIVIRNICFDEIWQWEDAINKSSSKIGDYDWFGWAYFKIGFCGYIWIDHCFFGKSYDGQIDYANANFHSSKSTAFRAPYGFNTSKGITISWCDFSSGSKDKDCYLYKMMKEIEDDYLSNNSKCLYYNSLRDAGISFDDIFNALVVPQKKGFLLGDDQDYKEENHVEYDYNLEINVTFANCKITNFEDRMPKVRGGNVYMHNCIFDSKEYYEYKAKLSSLGLASIVSKVNSSWKCALTSQGIVCGQGASVRADNCIFIGIKSLLKNNDSGSPAPYSYGGYSLNNCRYVCESIDYTGSSSDSDNKFTNATPSTLSKEYFKWNTIDGNTLYTPKVLIDLDDLSDELNNSIYGVGINNKLQDALLMINY